MEGKKRGKVVKEKKKERERKIGERGINLYSFGSSTNARRAEKISGAVARDERNARKKKKEERAFPINRREQWSRRRRTIAATA